MSDWCATSSKSRKKENHSDAETSSEAGDVEILQAFHYIMEIPGKEIRTKLNKAFNHWLNVPVEICSLIGEVIKMLHNASLLIDDIEDNSKLRRGVPVAHSIFGIASTINAANFAYFLALERLQKLGHPDATTVFTEQLLELHRGQGMEIYWRDNFICPTESQYMDMVKRKTGGLFGLAIRLLQLFSQNKSDFSNLIGLMGLYFQVRDDYCNLKSMEYTANKSFCEDLTEGKFSFPIIHAIQSHPEAPQVMNILRQRTTDVELKKYTVELLERLGSFEYTRKFLSDLDQQARNEIKLLGGNGHLLTVLDELMNW